jgi:hypothetical protein
MGWKQSMFKISKIQYEDWMYDLCLIRLQGHGGLRNIGVYSKDGYPLH